MRLLTWNINALEGTVRNFRHAYGDFKGFFVEHRLDILCVQEHKLSEAKLTKELACLEGIESFWDFSTKKLGYSGVATWCRLGYGAQAAEANCLGDDLDEHYSEGRVVVTDHGHFVLINVYVPNAGPHKEERPRLRSKLSFLRELTAKADAYEAEGREVVIVGDLNVAASPQDVHHSYNFGRLYGQEELALLTGLRAKYTDVWRQLHPNTEDVFTVWNEKTSARVFNEGLRIDYILISKGLLDKVVSCEVLNTTPPKWSDHAGILIEFKDVEEAPPKPPCALSSRRMKRLNDTSQRSIAAMFGRKRPAEGPAAAAGSTAAAARPAKQAALPTAVPETDAAVPATVGAVQADAAAPNGIGAVAAAPAAASVDQHAAMAASVAPDAAQEPHAGIALTELDAHAAAGRSVADGTAELTERRTTDAVPADAVAPSDVTAASGQTAALADANQHGAQTPAESQQSGSLVTSGSHTKSQSGIARQPTKSAASKAAGSKASSRGGGKVAVKVQKPVSQKLGIQAFFGAAKSGARPTL